MKKLKTIPVLICILTLVLILVMSACNDPKTKIDRDKIVEANAVDKIIQDHNSIREIVKYYENLDDDETYETTSYYGAENGGTYFIEGREIENEGSNERTKKNKPVKESHFNTYVINNTEYHYFTDTGKMTVYPLTDSYIKDFKGKSFAIDTTTDEAVTAVAYKDKEVLITTEVELKELYTEKTIQKMEELAGKKLKTIRYIYTVDKDSLLLKGIEAYYVAKDDTELLFSKTNMEYDLPEDKKPSFDILESYINAPIKRNITVVEKTDTGTISTKFEIPGNLSPDFKCFETIENYTIYTDENCTYKYTAEAPGEDGIYPDATFYAKKNPGDSDDSKEKSSK